MRSSLFALLACVVVSTVTAPALAAEPTADDRERASALFEEGRGLAKEGKFAEACPKLEESQRLDPGIGTLYNVADCLEHVGRLASAWAAFLEVARLAKLTGQGDREQVARGRADKLAPRLAKLRITMTGAPPGARVVVDGRSEGVSLDVDVPVDPGEHAIAVSAPDHVPLEKAVRVEPGSGLVVVDLPKLEPRTTVAPPPPPPIAPPPAPAPPRESTWTWHKTAAVAAAGAGALGLGAGGFFGLRASSQWSDAEASCPNGACNDAGYTQWEDARSSARVANVMVGVGVVLVATGVVLWVLAPSQGDSRASALAAPRQVRR